MTGAEKEKIRFFRMEGLGYGAIAARLGLSENTVKSFCRRNHLTGVAAKEAVTACRHCGQSLANYQDGKEENSALKPAAGHGGRPTRSLWIEKHFIL